MAVAQTRIEQSDPKAYQKKLEGLVGGREPVTVLSETAQALRDIVRQKPAAAFHERPFAGKWTPGEVIGHMGDAEWAMSYRTRTVLCDDHPAITAYDQERWVRALEHGKREASELVETFATLRGLNVALWKSLTSEQLKRTGLHAERGEESLGQMLRLLAGHDLSHLDQLRRYLAAVKS